MATMDGGRHQHAVSRSGAADRAEGGQHRRVSSGERLVVWIGHQTAIGGEKHARHLPLLLLMRLHNTSQATAAPPYAPLRHLTALLLLTIGEA